MLNTSGIPENIPFQFGEDHMMYPSKYNDTSLRAFPNGKTHRTPPPYSHSAHQEKLKKSCLAYLFRHSVIFLYIVSRIKAASFSSMTPA